MKPSVLFNKVFNNDTPMDRAAVPEKHHVSFKMAKKVAKKSNDLHARNVDRVEVDVEPQPLSV